MKGENIDFVLTLSNRSRIPKFLIMFNVAFDFSSALQNLAVQTKAKKRFFKKPPITKDEINGGFIYVGSKGKSQVNLSYAPQRRGVIKLKQIEIFTSVPFGFKKVNKKIGIEKTIYVYPKIYSISKNFKSKISNLEIENYPDNIPAGIRNYQPYDSLKMIHWPSSAKHQQTMAKKFDSEITQKNLNILINDTNEEKFETIMDISISLLSFLIFGEEYSTNPMKISNLKNQYPTNIKVKIGGIHNIIETFYDWNLTLKYLAELKACNSKQILNIPKNIYNEKYYWVTYKGDNKKLENALLINEDDFDIR